MVLKKIINDQKLFDDRLKRLKNFKTLAYPEVDKKRGFEEIINSPIYRNYVVSEDGKTSGIVVYLKKDERLEEYIKIKDKYFNQSKEIGLSKEEKGNYKKFLRYLILTNHQSLALKYILYLIN